MAEISNITIKNIKGFMDQNNSFDVHILPNKVNLLVAPNGFGKSSIAKGFESLNSNRLDLPDDLYHDKNSPILPEISITYDNNVLSANKDQNTISSIFDVTVINSGLKATAKVRNIPHRVIQQGVMEVEDIVLRTSIPRTAHIDYNFSQIKASFGKNKKVLTNLSEKIAQNGIAKLLIETYPLLSTLQKRGPKTIIRRIIEQINNQNGTAETILRDLDEHTFDDLENIGEYQELQNKVSGLRISNTKFSRFEVFFQIIWLYNNKRANLQEAKRHEDYVNLKNSYNAIIRSIDTTGRNIAAHEQDGKLIVSFPKADTISNGQRDIITFITSLVKFRMNYNNEKKQILIIDEVFDYLDDANVVAAQYFLSDFLSENREDFYLIILSHITEEHFRGWVLKKKLNTQYIKPTQAKASINTKAFIAFRDSLKKTNEANYSALSNYYFHYNPKTNEQDLSAIYQAKDGLKKNWFEGTNLHSDILPELNKYLKGQESYDPYAVCFAIRYACEKNIYAQLRNDEERTIFLSKKKTKDKLEWAEDAGYDVPVIYYMLGIIFNEAEHITGIEIAQNKERSCVYRLDNGAIRQMIIELFNYTEEDIAIDAII